MSEFVMPVKKGSTSVISWSGINGIAPLCRSRSRWAWTTSLAAAWILCSPRRRSNLTATSLIFPKSKRNRRRATSYPSAFLSQSQSRQLLFSATRAAGGLRCFSTCLPQKNALSQDSAKSEQAALSPDQLHNDASAEKTSSSKSSSAREITDITDIVSLMRHPALLDNIKKPRHPIVLCHGLYGFDVRGPFLGLEIHYWASVLDILRKKVGAEVIVRGVPGTGAIAHRALELHKFLGSEESGVRGRSVNFIAHSMGGLDARHIISVIKPKPEEYKPVSLTTISTPHKGSPFMDWCNANVGTGNDRVEAEIREARKRLGETQLEEAQKENHKLPFSLKTPLFVRPLKSKPVEEFEGGTKSNDGVLNTVKSTVVDMATRATSPSTTPPSTSSDTSNEEEKKKKERSSSILNFSVFNKALASLGGSFSSYMLGVLDQPAYAMLSTRYMSHVFNPSTPNSPDVAYFSIASRKRSLPIWHPLWLPKLVLDAAAESRSTGGERDGSGDALGSNLQGNDGLVSVESAKWGTFLGVIEGCDHWDLRGGGAPRWRGRVNPATGKSWPEESSKEQEKEKKKEKSWIDINTVLGKLLNRNKEADTKKKEAVMASNPSNDNNKKESESVAAKKEEKSTEDEGILGEVASWISDRLPQGDETRRAEAERAADEQDRQSQTKYSSKESSPPRQDLTEQQASLEEETSTKMDKLRREAAWQEELGHNDAAGDLRRDMAWHRSEWDQEDTNLRSSSSQPSELDEDRQSREKRERKERRKAEEADELERFWIALCRHLWSHGY